MLAPPNAPHPTNAPDTRQQISGQRFTHQLHQSSTLFTPQHLQQNAGCPVAGCNRCWHACAQPNNNVTRSHTQSPCACSACLQCCPPLNCPPALARTAYCCMCYTYTPIVRAPRTAQFSRYRWRKKHEMKEECRPPLLRLQVCVPPHFKYVQHPHIVCQSPQNFHHHKTCGRKSRKPIVNTPTRADPLTAAVRKYLQVCR